MTLTWSYIDYGNKDFLKDLNDKTIMIEAKDHQEAENWLLDNHKNTDWSNSGTKIICWEDEDND